MWYKIITRFFLFTLVAAFAAFAQFTDPGQPVDPMLPTDPVLPASSSSSQPKSSSSGHKLRVLFMPSWTNTSAIMHYNGGDSLMTPLKNYCGWFVLKLDAPRQNLNVTFSQTIGNIYQTMDGPEKVPTGAFPVGAPIVLDSIAAISDSVWIIGNPNGPPDMYASYPQRLGECPVRNISVMMFDWHHGSGSNAENALDEGVSADFGSGGCENSQGMKGMVEVMLGANGVPQRATNFPEKCQITEHLNYWFLPEIIGQDATGKTYTNATCRDLELKLDDEGYWLGRKNNSSPEGGLFFLDDFEYLDEAKTVPNKYYDQLKDKKGQLHNFGFTMKFQAKFEYVPGQYFEFKGDDDVWVFINNRLVVDIGGQHSELSGKVDLDTLGLVEGETYPFHIFYVERHTSSSNFMMRTSMDLHTDASIFLTDDRSTELIKNYDVWQIIKKDALTCDFNTNDLSDIDTTEGPSNYRLTGGNLGEKGVMLDTAGMWFEGIYIDPSWTKFSIDSTSIVEKNGLAPGHYYLEVSLKRDPTQVTGVWITIPPYSVPTIVYTKDDWTPLGAQVLGDTLQIGDWAYEMYKVNIRFLEDWAKVSIYNQNINLSSSDPLLQVVDENGKPISKVVLDSTGKASFYVIANGPVSGASLQAKGVASSAAVWSNLIFREPPIPRITNAIMIDRNGDGRGDSVFIHFDKAISDKNRLDSLKFAFGEGFPVLTKYDLSNGNTDIAIVSDKQCEPHKLCGFGSLVFTGGKDGLYSGSIDTWFTYTENNKEYHFHIAADPLADGVNPIVTQAVKSITKNGHVLSLTFSEAITDETMQFFQEMFRYNCVRAGANVDPEKPMGYSEGAGNKMDLLFTMSTYDAVIPSVGDSIGFVPGVGGSTDNVAKDMAGIKPHQYSPMVRITGEQEMEITGTDVRPISPENPIIDTAKTTEPFLITNKDIDAKAVSDSLGVQGHLVGFDVAELIATQTAEEIASLDALVNTLLNGGKDDTTYTVNEITREQSETQLIGAIATSAIGGFSDSATTGIINGTITLENYKIMLPPEDLALFEEYVERGIEASRDTLYEVVSAADKDMGELLQQIIDGTIPAKELMKAGVSEEIIDAIKEGVINESNINLYRSGTLSLVQPEDVKLKYETKYFTHLGHYVGGSSGTIMCSDESVYGKEGCLVNSGNLFLAWNMRSDNGRLAATGVYIARIHIQIKIGSKTASDITRDLLWGVRRGGKNELDLGAILNSK